MTGTASRPSQHSSTFPLPARGHQRVTLLPLLPLRSHSSAGRATGAMWAPRRHGRWDTAGRGIHSSRQCEIARPRIVQGHQPAQPGAATRPPRPPAAVMHGRQLLAVSVSKALRARILSATSCCNALGATRGARASIADGAGPARRRAADKLSESEREAASNANTA